MPRSLCPLCKPPSRKRWDNLVHLVAHHCVWRNGGARECFCGEIVAADDANAGDATKAVLTHVREHGEMKHARKWAAVLAMRGTK